jgi:hypothetical protein
MSDQTDADFDGVTPDIKRAAEKRAAAIAADRGEGPSVEAPADAQPKKSRGQTTR